MLELEQLLHIAHLAGASKLLLMAGQPPVMRVGAQLSPPLQTEALNWEQTEQIAEALLAQQTSALDENGSAEVRFDVGGIRGEVTIFYGNGCHNLVFHIQPQN